MPSLRELQTGFALALFDGSASRQAPGIRSNGLSPAARLGFYRTNVFENYRKALAATYPALQAVVGTGCFSQLAQEYTRRHRSRSSDVGLHGERFADRERARTYWNLVKRGHRVDLIDFLESQPTFRMLSEPDPSFTSTLPRAPWISSSPEPSATVTFPTSRISADPLPSLTRRATACGTLMSISSRASCHPKT